MARAEFHPEKDRERLFENTLKDPKNGIRDHAILRLIYGAPVRPIELIRFITRDFVNDRGEVEPNRHCVVRAEVSFNGRERPMPLLDPVLIDALQKWIDFRIENGWGVTKTGFIDLDMPFFLRKKNEGFKLITTTSEGIVRHNADNINRIIRQRMKDNGLTGTVDSALKTWTLERHRAGGSTRIIWQYRGDNDIESVKRVIQKDPVRLGALVENIY